LFPRQVRYTGVALGFNFGTIIAGGSAPYIAAQLVESTGNSMAPAFWVMGVALIGIVTVATMRETGRAALPK
jgi:MHS family proline/betaine transporter-like MFS transporter